MKIKVCDASIEALNYLVAKIEGHEWRCPWLLEKEGYVAWQSYEQAWGNPTPDYCSNWYEMGPIIDREVIELALAKGHHESAKWMGVKDNSWFGFGQTHLIAAVRCFVYSKLGKEVEIPEEILE